MPASGQAKLELGFTACFPTWLPLDCYNLPKVVGFHVIQFHSKGSA